MCKYTHNKQIVFELREYLTIYPDGEVMKKFRTKGQHLFPFGMDSWSEDNSKIYLISNRTFILEALENPSVSASANDDKAWVDKIKNMILDVVKDFIDISTLDESRVYGNISETLRDDKKSQCFSLVSKNINYTYTIRQIKINDFKNIWLQNPTFVYSPGTGLVGVKSNVIDYLKFRIDLDDDSAIDILDDFESDYQINVLESA